jgi:hypothetical protein
MDFDCDIFDAGCLVSACAHDAKEYRDAGCGANVAKIARYMIREILVTIKYLATVELCCFVGWAKAMALPLML